VGKCIFIPVNKRLKNPGAGKKKGMKKTGIPTFSFLISRSRYLILLVDPVGIEPTTP
jgi:hypothetical protein